MSTIHAGARSCKFDNVLVASKQDADWLEQQVGLKPGTRLVVAMENSLDHVELILASWRLGVQFVAVPPTVSRASFEGIVSELQPRAAVVDASNRRLCEATLRPEQSLGLPGHADMVIRRIAGGATTVGADIPVRPDQGSSDWSSWLACLPASIHYTSGSTADAKGVILSWEGILAKGREVFALFAATDHDRVMPLLPLSHVYGLYFLLGALACGADVVIEPESATFATVASRLMEHAPSIIACPPVVGGFLFGRRPVDLPMRRNLRILTMGGAATPPAVTANILNHLPDTRVFLSYGLAETYSTVCCNEVSRSSPNCDPLSVGVPAFGAFGQIRHPETDEPVRSGDVGELCIGGTITSGYFCTGALPRRDAFTKDGLFRTGDLACMNECGEVSIRGRLKEMINAGGLSIMPSEIEEVVKSHSDVRDCGVFGEKNGELEVVCAAVVLHEPGLVEGERALMLENLFRHCNSHLSKKMVPRRIILVDAIPRGSLGKIKRAELSAMCTTR